MRIVVAALVLLNLGFFAWAQWLDRPVAEARPAAEAAGKPVARLILAGEAGGGTASADTMADTAAATIAAPAPSDAVAPATPATAPAAAASPAAVPAPVVTAACVSYGPLEDAARAARLAEALKARGLTPRPRTADGNVPDGWRVLVGGLAGPADVARALRTLEAGAVPDATPLENAPDDRRIAVGLFRARERADRRAAEVRRLGLTPVIAERLRPGTAHWVDVTPPAGTAPPPADALLAETPAGHTVRVVDCPPPAGGAAAR